MDKFIMILIYVCVPFQVEMVMISLCCLVEWRPWPWPIRSASRRVEYRCGSTVSKFNFHRAEWQRACRVYSRAHPTHRSSHYYNLAFGIHLTVTTNMCDLLIISGLKSAPLQLQTSTMFFFLLSVRYFIRAQI